MKSPDIVSVTSWQIYDVGLSQADPSLGLDETSTVRPAGSPIGGKDQHSRFDPILSLVVFMWDVGVLEHKRGLILESLKCRCCFKEWFQHNGNWFPKVMFN